MSDMVSKMKQEIINRSNSFEEQTKGTKDYNEISEELKYLVNNKYEKVMNAEKIEKIM